MIDLRSDTVTKPTPAMREVIAHAQVGDDVFGNDPTVNTLQEMLALQFGFEAGLFFPSGTQCNLAALMTHCQRGDEYLVGQQAHTYVHEGGGAAVLGSIQPQPIEHQPDGTLSLSSIEKAIKPPDDHYARTRLLTLENTFGGKVLPIKYIHEATALAHQKGLFTHLDGARIFNAAVALNVEPSLLVKGFDSVSVCLSKGLGAPVGSALLGSRTFITQARRWRKVLGGGMRQVGILAAAGIYALQHHVPRLADDHRNAKSLADGIRHLPGLRIEEPETNIVWVDLEPSLAGKLVPALAKRGILATGSNRVRFVTHLDISAADIENTVKTIQTIVSSGEMKT